MSDHLQDTAPALIADYRHACEEWGATMLDSWHDRVIELEDKLLAGFASLRESLAGVQQENERLRKLEAIAMVERGIHGGFPEGGLLAVGQSLLDRAATIERLTAAAVTAADRLDLMGYAGISAILRAAIAPESPATSQIATPHSSETAK